MAIYNAIQKKIALLQSMRQGCNKATVNYINGKIAGLMSIIELMEAIK